jgi:hypothetical protein
VVREFGLPPAAVPPDHRPGDIEIIALRTTGRSGAKPGRHRGEVAGMNQPLLLMPFAAQRQACQHNAREEIPP